jgi:hypothetical protein
MRTAIEDPASMKLPRGVRVLALVTSLAAAVIPGISNAAYLATLSFIQPTGTVGPTDSIPVWIRLNMDPGSDPLDLNNNPGGAPPFGVPLANYPTTFSDSTVSQTYTGTLSDVTSVYLNTFFSCSGTFITGCNGNPYDWTFNTTGPDSINFIPDAGTPTVLVPAGGQRDYLFGAFSPTAGGPVAPGTYFFYGAGLTLNFIGTGTAIVQDLDQNGNPIPLLDQNGDPLLDQNGDPVYQTHTEIIPDARASLDLAVTPCAFDAQPLCQGAFSREVTAVPVPAAAWFFGSSVALLGWARRRLAVLDPERSRSRPKGAEHLRT